MVLDKASDDLIMDSDVEHTQLTSEPSEAEPEQITDITETPQQPELVGDAPLDSELIQDGADVKPEND